MINHEKKLIFIHIPKCAGTSIEVAFFDNKGLDWETPDYDRLYGWCPKTHIHLQHATPVQLLENGLVSREAWEQYFKFTFVRNPWDRAYSDYLWMMKDRQIEGTFEEYISRSGGFEKSLNFADTKEYRGDHLTPQTEFLGIAGIGLDFIGRFENFEKDIETVMRHLGEKEPFAIHENKNEKRKLHYATFYNKERKQLVERFYQRDITELNYAFDNKPYLAQFERIMRPYF